MQFNRKQGKNLNRQFIKEDIKVSTKQIEGAEHQVKVKKATTRCLYSFTEMTKIKKP